MNISVGKYATPVALIVMTLFASCMFFAGTVRAATGLGTLHVSEVINGGSANTGDFTVILKNTTGSNTSSISASGGSITFTSLEPGTYTLSQTGPAGYTPAFSGACDVNGKVTVTGSGSLSCTITDIYGVISGGGSGGNVGNRGDRGSVDSGRPAPTLPTR